MGCEPLDVEQHGPDPLQFRNKSDKGDLRCVGLSVEHGFASEESIDVDAVEATHKLAGLDVPSLDTVGPTESMEFGIRHVNLVVLSDQITIRKFLVGSLNALLVF